MTRWLREAEAGAELALSAAIIVRNTDALVEAVRYASCASVWWRSIPTAWEASR